VQTRGVFVDKIVRGAKPDELPVERVTKFETAIKTRAAKITSPFNSTTGLVSCRPVIE
jgi:putative ABC transport system substrate-binding protein